MIEYTVCRFQRWHAAVIMAEGEPAGGVYVPGEQTMRFLEQSPNSVTLMVDGLPVVCGGTIELWPGRSQAWTFVSNVAGPHLLMATKTAQKMLRAVPGRVEMTVVKDFVNGHRWARMLGFEVETPLLRAYGPRGEDHVGYTLHNVGV